MSLNLHGITPLTHLGIIRVQGDDAVKFLHGQLTQDFALLGPQQARLTAFLSAKGRMQASFIGFKRSATEVLLVCSADLLAPTLKRLSMFVLRAKAKLTDASAEFALYGIAGNSLQALAPGNALAWSKTDIGAATLVHLYPAAGQARGLWIAPADAPAPSGPALPSTLWAWSEVQSGVATLSAPLVDAFVPQMLNYESVGGVNFKKGCYPGQEVVARSQFRGAIKRRTYLAHSNTEVLAGAEIFSPDDAEQACGTVVQTAPAPQGGWDALVVLSIHSAERGQLHVGPISDGVALELAALPYTLVEDI